MEIETSIEITRTKIIEVEIGPIKIHYIILKKLTEVEILGIIIIATVLYTEIIADILLLNATS